MKIFLIKFKISVDKFIEVLYYIITKKKKKKKKKKKENKKNENQRFY